MQTYYLYQCIDDENKFWQARGGWVKQEEATAFPVNETYKFPPPPRGKLYKLEQDAPFGEKRA